MAAMRVLSALLVALAVAWTSSAQARVITPAPCAHFAEENSRARAHARGHAGNLVYAQARYLDPTTGRFLSLDPVAGSTGDPFTTQGFTYVSGMPTRFTDPTGRCLFGVECTDDSASEIIDAAEDAFQATALDLKRFGIRKIQQGRSFVIQNTIALLVGGVSPPTSKDVIDLGVGVGSRSMQRVADASVRYENLGATTSEEVAGAASDLSGMTSVIEGATGHALEGEDLSNEESYGRVVIGAEQVALTALGGAAPVESFGRALIGEAEGAVETTAMGLGTAPAARAAGRGLRRSAMNILSESDIAFLKNEARAIEIPEDFIENNMRFNEGSSSGYVDRLNIIRVRGDIFPTDDPRATSANALLSPRAALAHEYYGHQTASGTTVLQGAWNDEFRASFRAAKSAPGLSDEDRMMLTQDALDRASDAGVSVTRTETIRKLLFPGLFGE
jgi:RHS repeat-associated protein